MKNYKHDGSCTVCNEIRDGFVCLHHLKSRGSGGSDDSYNLLPLCHWCHVTVHNIGLVSFAKKHESVKSFLLRNNWELCSGKWIHQANNEEVLNGKK